MADAVTIFHNPRCSKSRDTLALLEARGLSPTIVRYLETPPDAQTLRTLLSQLGMTPRALLRRGEDLYRELGLDDASLSDQALIDAMVAHPRLIERPIVVVGERAALGRPPEQVLSLLS
ncbi:MAG: arsenate reductase (glutaredoxin) [Gammaproteobacteria bacterium]|nr:arsenate reductase (glutaredoxin) [Gammaproteobacteria bacterium]